MIKLPVSMSGVIFEKETAMLDAKWVIDEWGDSIEWRPRGESDITRDKYNSIKKRATISAITMKAFPITFNPIDDILMKAGLREKVDVMIYTAMQDWNDHDVDPFDEIDPTRDTVVLKGKSYLIKEKGFANQFGDSFLNVTFGMILR